MERTHTIRQRVLICETCKETLAVIDGISTGKALNAYVTFRLTYDKDEYVPTCHGTPTEGQLMTAAKRGVDVPGCYWERGVA
jgi:hypothetical protein